MAISRFIAYQGNDPEMLYADDLESKRARAQSILGDIRPLRITGRLSGDGRAI
jgi:hypothetical protein